MTTQELTEALGLKRLSTFEPREVTGVFVSDMLSDVMAGAKSGDIWVTIQTHKSIVPAANLVDVAAIIISGGKDVPRETMDLATKYNIAILSSDLPVFELVGKLHGLNLSSA
jgi:hypothetical protein